MYLKTSISFSLLAKMKTFWVLRASETEREIIVQTTRISCNQDEQTISRKCTDTQGCPVSN